MESVSEDYWSVQRQLTPFLELQDKSEDDMLPRYTGDIQRQLLELQPTGQRRGRHAGLMLPPNAATPGPLADRTVTEQHAG